MTVSDTHADTIREALDQLMRHLEWADEEIRLIGDRGDSVVYREEREAFDRWQRGERDALLAELDRERARADRAEAALRAHKTGSRESSAADVDGASYDAGHHESVGERQGRQPVLPVRLVIDGNGYVWRDFGEEGVLSMAPSNPDNEPVPEPLTYYVRAALSAGSGGRETTP